MKKIITTIIFISFTIIAISQEFNWANSFGGISGEQSNSIKISQSNNIFLTGHYSDIVDFDASPAVFNLSSNGYTDIFIQKTDMDGNFIWAKSIGGIEADHAYSIFSDQNNNIYLTGDFQETVDFDPNSGISNLSSNGYYDIFITKLDMYGNLLWAKSIGGIDLDRGMKILADISENTYVIGDFQGTVDFNPGTNIYNLTSNGNSDIFILKLDSTGNFVWAKSLGAASRDHGYDMAIDTLGNLLVTGEFSQTVDFNPGTEVYNVTSNGSSDIFILKLNEDGDFISVITQGGGLFDLGWSIKMDSADNIYLLGEFKDTVDFDPGAGIFNITSNGYSDIFIQKLDSSGNLLWVNSVGGTTVDYGRSLVLDTSNNVFLTGGFTGEVDFDSSENDHYLFSNGSMDIFIQMLDNMGNFQWANSIGGELFDSGLCLDINNENKLTVAGIFKSTVDFDPSTGIYNLTSNGINDIFTLQLNNYVLGSFDGNLNIDFKLFPNPAENFISIHKLVEPKEFTIYDCSGRKILKGIANDKSDINIELLSSGFYYIKIENYNIIKFIKK